ncbi:MAG: hypothetical protein OEM62_06235 [Acidobacteriota bacterium]|nr:hypothetical protein [Acidobacteriota bacterium]
MSESDVNVVPQAEASRPSFPGWLQVAPLILGLVLCALYLAAEVSYLGGELGLPLDDSWIHLQFARNLAHGDGLSYNPGELVAGSTAPLWTAVLSLLFMLPGSPLLWAKLVGAGFYAGGIAASRQLALELDMSPGLAIVAAVMTAATGWLVWSALSGMEVPLFIFLSMWGVILHIRERRDERRPPLSLFLLGAGVLARPEGLLLLALAVVDRLILPTSEGRGVLRLRRPRLEPVLTGGMAAAILIAPVGLFNLAASGSSLPTTFDAKSTGLQSLLPNLHALYEMLSIFFSVYPYFTFTAVAGCLVMVERLGRKRDVGLLPALWLIGLPLAYSTLGGAQENVIAGNFGRYYFPLFPILVVLGLLGVERAVRASVWTVRAAGARLPVGFLLLAVVAWPAVTGVHRCLGRYLQSLGNVQQSDVEMARWLSGRLAPEALLAVNDVGALKYLLPNPIVDLAGIIDPEAPLYIREAKSQGRDWHDGVLRFLEEERPDYLVIFPEWYPRFARPDSPFRLLYRLEIPHNITMGGNSVGVYSTPWTRYPLSEPTAPELP